MKRLRSHQDRNAFTLVEMLVVLGIIVLLISVIIPAVMRARRQARFTTCMNNFRQIGALYVQYAERNEDYIPLGTSRFKDPDHPGEEPYTPRRPPPINTPWPWPGYHTRNNQYLWVKGAPSAAMGPFLLSKLINPDNAKILFCPSEQIILFRWEANRENFEKAVAGEPVTVVIGYAVRPIKRLWTHDHERHTVEYPLLMPKLMRNDRIALVAEHPQFQPYNHGSENEPLLNVLYGDGSVRSAGGKLFQPGYTQYIALDNTSGQPHGYTTASNNFAMDEQAGGAGSSEKVDIWTTLDHN